MHLIWKKDCDCINATATAREITLEDQATDDGHILRATYTPGILRPSCDNCGKPWKEQTVAEAPNGIR